MDLDNFKFINDSFGHDKGDEILKEVCQRVHNLLKCPNEFYRIGGDEFILLLQGTCSPDDIENFAHNIMECLSFSFQIDTHQVCLSCSIGVAIFPDHTTSPDKLLIYSDAAMYQAKVNGKNSFCFFDRNMETEIANRVNLQNMLGCCKS